MRASSNRFRSLRMSARKASAYVPCASAFGQWAERVSATTSLSWSSAASAPTLRMIEKERGHGRGEDLELSVPRRTRTAESLGDELSALLVAARMPVPAGERHQQRRAGRRVRVEHRQEPLDGVEPLLVRRAGGDHRQDEPREHHRGSGVLAAIDELAGGVLGRGERALELDPLDEEPGMREDEPGAVRPKVVRDPLEPAGQRLHLRCVEHRLRHRLEQLRGRLLVSGLQQVVDRLGHLSERPVRLGRAAVQLRRRGGVRLVESGSQEGAEEVVVAVPVAVAVEPLREDVPGDEPLAQDRGVRVPRHRRGHLGGEPIEDRGLQEEPLGGRRLCLQNLLRQIVEEPRVVETPGDLLEPLARLAAEDHAGDPPLGELVKGAGLLGPRRGGAAPEKLRRLALRERQIGRAHHQAASARAHREPRGRWWPRRDRQMDVPGEIAHQGRQRLLRRWRERVDVVQDERQIVGGREDDLVADRLDLIRHSPSRSRRVPKPGKQSPIAALTWASSPGPVSRSSQEHHAPGMPRLASPSASSVVFP